MDFAYSSVPSPEQQDAMMTEADAGDPARKRYYTVALDLKLNPRFEFLNKERALIERRQSGTHRHRLRDLEFHFNVGVPPLAEKPQLLLGINEDDRAAPLDFYGFDAWFVSDRLKQLLCAIDRDAFEATECEARDPRGNLLEPYWWIDVVRVLDCVDEERSELTRQTANPFASADPVNRVRYMKLQDIRMKPEVGTAHAFKLAPASHYTIFDGAIVDACRSAEMRGLCFTPLQPPAPDERGGALQFDNHPYWTDRGYAA